MTPVDPAPQGVWPVTIAGWMTLGIAVSTLMFLVYDKIAGKSKAVQRMEGQLETLQAEVEDLTATHLVLNNAVMTLNETILKLTFELKGVDGQNGAKGDIREIRAELRQIHERNQKADALHAALEAQLEYMGPERREGLRRLVQGRRSGEDT